MWTAVAILIAPIVIGTVVLLIPGSGSLGSAPAGYFALGMILAMAVAVAALGQIAAGKMRWTIHPAISTFVLLGVIAVVASGLELLFTGTGLAFVATAVVLLAATLVMVGPRPVRAPATILAATVISVAVYVLIDVLVGGR
jgi:hypothetical protein